MGLDIEKIGKKGEKMFDDWLNCDDRVFYDDSVCDWDRDCDDGDWGDGVDEDDYRYDDYEGDEDYIFEDELVEEKMEQYEDEYEKEYDVRRVSPMRIAC